MGSLWKNKPGNKIIVATSRMQFDIRGKSLRYGAVLSPTHDGFKVSWTKECGTLKASGKYKM